MVEEAGEATCEVLEKLEGVDKVLREIHGVLLPVVETLSAVVQSEKGQALVRESTAEWLGRAAAAKEYTSHPPKAILEALLAV